MTWSEKQLADALLPTLDEMCEWAEEAGRMLRALPVEEQQRIRAEQKAAYEAKRCAGCGCHPDEHGDY